MAVLGKQRKRQHTGQLWDLSTTQSENMNRKFYGLFHLLFSTIIEIQQLLLKISKKPKAQGPYAHKAQGPYAHTCNMYIIHSIHASIHSTKAFKQLFLSALCLYY